MSTNEVKIRLAMEGVAQVGAQLSGVEQSIGRLSGALSKIGHYGAALMVLPSALNNTMGSAVRAADAVSVLQTQLRLATGSAGAATAAYTALFDIAQQGRVSFTELGTTFAAVSRAGKDLGISQDRLLTVTKSISQAMTIGGGSAQSMQAALVQLGQGLSSGVLRGQELNSIMEQTPRLAKAIADGLGVPIGALRKLGEAGQLTAEQVISALEKSAPQLAQEMSTATLTVGQAFTLLTNSATKFAGDADAASGATATLSGAMKTLSGSIDSVGSVITNNKDAFSAIASGLAGAATVAGLAAVAANIGKVRLAVIGLGAAMAANPVILVLTGIAAAAMALRSASGSAAKSQTGLGYAIADMNKRIAESEALVENAGLAGKGYKSDGKLEAMRTKRALLQQELAVLVASSTANESYDAKEDKRLAARTASSRAAAKDQESLDAIRGKLSGVPDGYAKSMAEIIRLNQAGVLVGKEYSAVLVQQQALLSKKGGAGTGAAGLSDAEKGLKTYNDLTAKATGLNANFAEQWALLNSAYKGGKISVDQLTQAQARLLAEQTFAKDAAKEQEEQIKAVTKAQEAAEKAYTDYSKGITDGLTKLRDGNKEQQDQIDRMGLSKDAIAALDAANLELQATKLDGLAIDRLVQYQDAINYQALKDQAAELRKLAVLKRQSAAKEVAIDAAKEAESTWKKTADSIENSLTDALMRGFESGKEFGRNLRDTLVNMFKTLVLRPTISAVMNPIAQGMAGMVGTMGTAAAGGVAGTAGTGLMGSIGGSAAWASMSAGMSQFGTAALASTQTLLGFGGATTTAAQAMTAVSTVNGATLMTTLGKAVPYVAIALAIAAAVGLFRKTKTVGAGISGTFGEDTSLESYTAKRKSGYLFGGPKYWDEKSPLDAATTRTLGNAFNAVKESAKSAATALGLSADSVTSYSKTFRLALTGDAAKDQAATEALFAGMSEDMARGILGSVKDVVTTVREEIAADYTEWGTGASGGFTERKVTTSVYTPSEFANEGETASQTLQRLAVSIKTVNGTFDVLGYDLLAVGLSGASTASKLIDAFGGLDAFAATTAGYYQNFYTDAERTARLSEVTGTALGKLGLTMPAMDAGARAWYRSAVELAQAQDMNVEANRTQLASLMALAPAINLLAPAFDAGAAAAEAAAELQVSWQQKLDIATGKTTQREIDKTAALLAADDATDLIINALYAYEDAATAAAAVTAAQDDAYGALLDANRAVYNSQQEAAQAQQQAAQATTEAANAIRDALAGAGQSIADFVKSLRASIASPATLAASYKTDLLLAQGGDLEASKRIPASGKAYLDSQIAGATSMVDVQRATARMASELAALPAVKTYEDKLLEAVNGVASAVGGTTSAVVDLHGNFMAGLTLNARSEIVKILEFIVDDTKMTPETKALALLASGSVSRVVALSATSLLRPQDQELALMTGGTIIKTIGTALGANDPLALSIAFAQSSTIEKVIRASGGLLNPDQATLLNAIGVYNKTVNIDVVVSSASLTAFQQLLMTTFGTISVAEIGNTTGLGGLNLVDLAGSGAIDRLNSIATYINTLDWSAAGANASAWSTYDAAKAYGVTQADIANATGYKLFDIQALFDNAKIPRFAAGTNYLPADMLAQVHEGERIVPKADNLLLMQRLQSPQSNNEALVAEIRSLNEKMGRLNDEVRALRASSERGNANTQVAADRLSGRQGVPFLVQVAT